MGKARRDHLKGQGSLVRSQFLNRKKIARRIWDVTFTVLDDDRSGPLFTVKEIKQMIRDTCPFMKFKNIVVLNRELYRDQTFTGIKRKAAGGVR